MFRKEDVKKTNSSYNVPNKSITVEYVRNIASTDDLILDYGAGKSVYYARKLRGDGFSVKAWEIGNNFTLSHDKDALSLKYDIIYAANVFNTHPSQHMMMESIKQIGDVLKSDGIFIVNYPFPRYSDIIVEEFVSILEHTFFCKRVDYNGYKYLWECVF